MTHDRPRIDRMVQPMRMMMELGQRPAFGAGVAEGDGVVAITARLEHERTVGAHHEPAQHGADAAERSMLGDHIDSVSSMRFCIPFPFFPASHLLPMATRRGRSGLRLGRQIRRRILPRAHLGEVPRLTRRQPLLASRYALGRPLRGAGRHQRGHHQHQPHDQRRQAADP